MKKIFIILAVAVFGILSSCKKSEFASAYPDPSKIATTTVEKQFAGFMQSNAAYIVPSYYHYFVDLRTSLLNYTQAIGWINSPGQYVAPAAGNTDVWNNYYGFLAQYRAFQGVFAAQSQADQQLKRIYMIAATIYFYDYTERNVDLHGDIPWSKAGMIIPNGGNYVASYAAYDNATSIYTAMLDGLKGFSDELNSISVSSGVQALFKNQDIVNYGSLDLWKKYSNSLRMRMLTRVSGVSSLSSRASTEMGAILGNPSSYPILTTNSDNILINVYSQSSGFNSQGWQSGLESAGWGGNYAGKLMIDHMNANSDPRERCIFQPGDSAKGVFIGVDPLANVSNQTLMVNGAFNALINRSTLTRNWWFPGILLTAAEVQFYAAEYYMKAGNSAAAQAAYENGITQSVKFFYAARALSQDNSSGSLTPTSPSEIATYIASPGISWTANASKLQLIATQKWIHLNICEPYENWAEIRRLKLPALTFWVDNSKPSNSLPPSRWIYPADEEANNTANWSAVSSQDQANNKIFWDVN